MKKKILKLLAGTLACAVIGSAVPMQSIYAAEYKTVEMQKTERVTSLNYFYVENLFLETPATQNLVLSLGNGTEDIEDVTLECRREDGSTEIWKSTRNQDELFLFSKEFDAGTVEQYEVTAVQYRENGQIREIVLAEQGVEAGFGVNKEYVRGGEKAEVSEAIEMSVVTIEKETVASTEENVSEALDIVDEATRKRRSAPDENLVIALDPGHDEKHVGAQGNNVKEEIANLKIAMACKEELETYSDVTVYMTRTTGACPYPGTSSIEDIKKRVEASAAQGADVFISFHLNSYTVSSANGATVFYPNNNWKPEVGAAGEKLAEKIQKELASLGLKDRGIEILNSDSAKYPDGSAKDAYTVINSAKEKGIPGLIIEHAFLTNASDAKNYLTEEGLKKLGHADAVGIANHYGLKQGTWEFFEGKGWKYKKSGKYLANQWHYINGKWYYFNTDEFMKVGWLTLNGQTSYLGEDGAAVIGWQTIDGKKYYFFSNTYMAKGQQKINGETYCFDSVTGVLQEKHVAGWAYENGKWYYYNTAGNKQTGWIYVNSKWYYMNAQGEMQTGWLTLGNDKYYLNGSGAALIGWQTIDGKKYYFNGSAKMLKGKQTIGGKEYLFDPVTGVLQEKHVAGWAYENGKWYYYNTAGNKQTGWIYVNSKWYYMNAQGEMQTGWLTLGNDKYYLNGSGAALIGWQTIDGKKYYFNGSAKMLRGKQTIGGKEYLFDPVTGVLQEKHAAGWAYENGKWYYYNTAGNKQTGWIYVNSKWYYMNAQGEMQIGWVYDNSKWYYMNGSGAMQTGWLTLGNDKYYLNGSGAALIGWQTIDGKKYYFNGSAKMLRGKQTIGGKEYLFDPVTGVLQEKHAAGWAYENGKWYYYNTAGNKQTGWIYVNSKWYYMNAQGEMQIGWVYDNSKWYYMNGSGAMQTGWLTLGNDKYYLNGSGAALIGWQTIDGKKYYFNGSAKMLRGKQTIGGKEYLFDPVTGVLQEKHASGWGYENGKWYYYDTAGNKQTDWIYVNSKWYYMNAQGEMQTGWLTLGKDKYYLNGSGAALIGWQTIDGKKYYFNGSARMVTGKQTIDGKEYFFDQNGVLIPDGAIEELKPVEGTYLIANASSVTCEQMVTYFERSQKVYPAEQLKKGGAPDIKTFCEIYLEEANAEGIAAEVAFAQAMIETGWLQFKGIVKAEQFNFAGIGATDDGVAGADFSIYGEEAVRMGIRAQIQHLKAYALPDITESTLKNPCVDPRFKYVKKGCAKYVEWLGIKENPAGVGWATSEGYGMKILSMIQDLNKVV